MLKTGLGGMGHRMCRILVQRSQPQVTGGRWVEVAVKACRGMSSRLFTFQMSKCKSPNSSYYVIVS